MFVDEFLEQPAFGIDICEHPVGGFFESLNQNRAVRGSGEQGADVFARNDQPPAVGGIEGERFCVERNEFAGELIAGNEADFAIGRGGLGGGLDWRKPTVPGLR